MKDYPREEAPLLGAFVRWTGGLGTLGAILALPLKLLYPPLPLTLIQASLPSLTALGIGLLPYAWARWGPR